MQKRKYNQKKYKIALSNCIYFEITVSRHEFPQHAATFHVKPKK